MTDNTAQQLYREHLSKIPLGSFRVIINVARDAIKDDALQARACIEATAFLTKCEDLRAVAEREKSVNHFAERIEWATAVAGDTRRSRIAKVYGEFIGPAPVEPGQILGEKA